MRKRLAMFLMMFVMILMSILSIRQPMEDMVKNDGEIEWHSYIQEKLI
ncbi:hypothetical protein [Wansuia hejianensis]|uniref:Uncharacterized protein n=1 Tax=Wansuia hejianensis TaxID=2763667 RepID=A0A926EY87_9FIRM|nr:hypothetical protein [Wansuia hejianensis]MBC8591176.1 hypothetical protein [Wansuia hejianensis]